MNNLTGMRFTKDGEARLEYAEGVKATNMGMAIIMPEDSDIDIEPSEREARRRAALAYMATHHADLMALC